MTPDERERLRADVEAATPGPWTSHEQGDANEYCLLAGGRWLVAFRQNGEMLPDRQNANARLIAQAPDLARALLAAEDRLARVEQARREIEERRADRVRETERANEDEDVAHYRGVAMGLSWAAQCLRAALDGEGTAP
jgi:hypothetical protein